MEYTLKKENGKIITVRQVQIQLLEMLEEIDRICKKRNISYFLESGSALGAYRHQGFIPWDDDLDIGITREEYSKFVQAMKEELSDQYIAQSLELDTRYNVIGPAMKIRKKDTFIRERHSLLMNKCPCDGIFVDIFIYDHVSSMVAIDLFFHLIECILMGIIVFLENLNLNPKISKYIYVHLAKLYGKLCKNSPYMGIELTWNFSSLKHPSRYPITDIFPFKQLKFENRTYPTPNNITSYLEQRLYDT